MKWCNVKMIIMKMIMIIIMKWNNDDNNEMK